MKIQTFGEVCRTLVFTFNDLLHLLDILVYSLSTGVLKPESTLQASWVKLVYLNSYTSYTFVCYFVGFFFFPPETGFFCVALVVLELTL